MHYIVGLGNPGSAYDGTRHNVGFFMVENFVRDAQLPMFVSSAKCSGRVSEGVVEGHEVQCLLPSTYMNKSGTAVAKCVPKKDVGKLIVLYDDVDIPVGSCKVSVGRGSGGHNGVQSIIESLGSKDFVRIRIGVAQKSFWTGNAQRPAAAQLGDFVLKSFTKRDLAALESLTPQVTSIIKLILTEGAVAAMQEYN